MKNYLFIILFLLCLILIVKSIYDKNPVLFVIIIALGIISFSSFFFKERKNSKKLKLNLQDNAKKVKPENPIYKLIEIGDPIFNKLAKGIVKNTHEWIIHEANNNYYAYVLPINSRKGPNCTKKSTKEIQNLVLEGKVVNKKYVLQILSFIKKEAPKE